MQKAKKLWSYPEDKLTEQETTQMYHQHSPMVNFFAVLVVSMGRHFLQWNRLQRLAKLLESSNY